MRHYKGLSPVGVRGKGERFVCFGKSVSLRLAVNSALLSRSRGRQVCKPALGVLGSGSYWPMKGALPMAGSEKAFESHA